MCPVPVEYTRVLLSLNVEFYGEKEATSFISDGTTILINVIQS